MLFRRWLGCVGWVVVVCWFITASIAVMAHGRHRRGSSADGVLLTPPVPVTHTPTPPKKRKKTYSIQKEKKNNIKFVITFHYRKSSRVHLTDHSLRISLWHWINVNDVMGPTVNTQRVHIIIISFQMPIKIC